MSLEKIQHSSTKKFTLAVGGLFLMLALLIYGGSLYSEFVTLDDSALIYLNPAIQGFTFANLKTIFTTFDPELYIPLTFLTYQFDYFVGGEFPFVYHLQNLLWHTANAVLVTLLIGSFLRNRVIGVLMGLLFLIHPLNTEAVVWASARKDLVSTFFFLSSIGFYLKHTSLPPTPYALPPTPYALPPTRWYVFSIVAFALALMAKVVVISLPIVLLLIDYLRERKWDKNLLIEKIPYLILAIIFGIVALIGKSTLAGNTDVMTMILLGVKSVFFYLEKMVWPAGLSVLYPYNPDVSILSPTFFIPLLGMVVVLGSLVILIVDQVSAGRKPAPVIRIIYFSVTFYLLTLLPTFFNLSKGGYHFLASDRYVYIPFIGILLLVGYGLKVFWNRLRFPMLRGVSLSIFVFLTIFLSLLSFFQSQVWANSETLYTNSATLYPDSYMAHLNLGNVYVRQQRLDEAFEQYDIALAIGERPEVFYNRGVVLEQLGKLEDAKNDYVHAISLRAAYPTAYINLGRILYGEGKKKDAAAHFEKAITYAPYLAVPHFNLGVIYAETGEVERSLEHYKIALDNDPNFVDAHVNLSLISFRLGRMQEMADHLARAVEINRNHPNVIALMKILSEAGMDVEIGE